MIKKMFYGLLFICSPLFAGELTTFDAITSELDAGKPIVVVVHDALCKMEDPNDHKIPVSTMVIRPPAVLFTENRLSFDAVKFAAGSYPLPNNGLIQRGSFLLNNSGQVSIIIAFFDAETNKKNPDIKDVKIFCNLVEGVKVYQG